MTEEPTGYQHIMLIWEAVSYELRYIYGEAVSYEPRRIRDKRSLYYAGTAETAGRLFYTADAGGQ